MTDYKSLVSLDKRKAESQRVLIKYPDRIPVIIDPMDKKQTFQLTKKKFLVPREIDVATLLTVIRNCHTRPSKNESLFLFCDNRIIMPSMLMTELYDMYKNSPNSEYKKGDMFLYLVLARENTFGDVLLDDVDK